MYFSMPPRLKQNVSVTWWKRSCVANHGLEQETRNLIFMIINYNMEPFYCTGVPISIFPGYVKEGESLASLKLLLAKREGPYEGQVVIC